MASFTTKKFYKCKVCGDIVCGQKHQKRCKGTIEDRRRNKHLKVEKFKPEKRNWYESKGPDLLDKATVGGLYQ